MLFRSVEGKKSKSPDSVALVYLSGRLLIISAAVDLDIVIPAVTAPSEGDESKPERECVVVVSLRNRQLFGTLEEVDAREVEWALRR